VAFKQIKVSLSCWSCTLVSPTACHLPDYIPGSHHRGCCLSVSQWYSDLYQLNWRTLTHHLTGSRPNAQS
jgi:hypothetical protein